MNTFLEGSKVYNTVVSGCRTVVVYKDTMVTIAVEKELIYGLSVDEYQGMILFTTSADGKINQQFTLHDELSIKLCKYLMNEYNVNNKRFADIVKLLLDI